MSQENAQREVIEFLSRPQSYGPTVEKVERIETHGAIVFLAGTRAYKLKRAVRFPYMDYSTPERRRAMCEAELSINRQTAPMLYEAVCPVTREADGLRIGGLGPAVDWLVVMRRFDQEALLDRVAARGELTRDLIVAIAEAVAAFHAIAPPATAFGGAAAMAAVVDGNRASLLEAAPAILDTGAVTAFDAQCRQALAAVADLLDRRRQDGFVRRCHGDLHLGNICLIDGRPVLFDAIEFNEHIASIDTLYDFAFLLMDLEHRRLRDLANAALNAYLDTTGDDGGLAALPLFLACRAGVRAHTSAAAARAQSDEMRRRTLIDAARSYLSLAPQFLAPTAGRIVAIGGLSGTGKSTVARAIAPRLGRAPGAVVLRSDVIRKRLAGVPPTTRLDAAAYTPAVSTRVYRELAERAHRIAAAGQVVIADAVFAKPEERSLIEEAARSAAVPFTGIWLTAPAAELRARIRGRTGDASDATVAVLEQQLTYELGKIAWERVDAGGDPSATAATVQGLI